MAREIYGFINTTEEQLANIERLFHLAQQFTLDQLRAQGEAAWLNPHGGVITKHYTGLERDTFTIPLYRIPETLE